MLFVTSPLPTLSGRRRKANGGNVFDGVKIKRFFFFRRLIAVTGKARTNWCYVYLWLVLHARQTRPITTASRSVRLARHDRYMIMIKATEQMVVIYRSAVML